VKDVTEKSKTMLTSLKSNETRRKVLKQLIHEKIKEEFGISFPLSTEQNYNSEKLFQLINCLVDMLAEALTSQTS
jgi:hypothetical protein